MANMAQLVNVIAPIFTSPEGLFLQTIFYPLLMHAEHRGTIALDAHCEYDAFAALGQDVNYVDTAASYDDATGTAYIHAVNLHRDQAATLRVAGDVAAPDTGVSVWQINGASPGATNSFEHPDAVTLTQHTQRDARTIELAPCSANTIALLLR
jgi:alpha-N-arabinofuranosidase